MLIEQGDLLYKYLETSLQGMIFLNSFTLLQMDRLQLTAVYCNRRGDTGMQVRRKCAFMHQQVQGQPSREPKKQSDQGAVGIFQNSRQLGCVFRDVEPPKFNSISRKSTTVLRPIHTVQFSKNTQTSHKYSGKQRSIAWCDSTRA